ncbi:MAG: 16S rRNA (cytosine(1402)-N(4))-methyltransferase RsmH [Paludibacteraceae bacterium]|nr:16S rRNA (cytosine(1402)-N(4))-methyltransferase RsmH [Paludibacteraceae bacterium]
MYHLPALLTETIEGLSIKPDGVYLDLTFGGGGHSRAILKQLDVKGRLFSFDQDEDALSNKIDDPRWHFVHSNFRYVKTQMRYYGIDKVDGILADLGVSFHHFDTAERGFSFRFSGPLDMRMNRKSLLTAATVVNTYSEEDLARILYLYGELRDSRHLARKIVDKRQKQPIETTEQLTALLGSSPDYARIFQALRIEVNDELGALQDMLCQIPDLLNKDGKVAILTYHSLEDRIVKNFFRTGNIEGKLEKDFYGNPLTPFITDGKAISPTKEEIENNPRSRSAKLRVAKLK